MQKLWVSFLSLVPAGRTPAWSPDVFLTAYFQQLECHLVLVQPKGMFIGVLRLFPIIDKVKISDYSVPLRTRVEPRAPQGVLEVEGRRPCVCPGWGRSNSS